MMHTVCPKADADTQQYTHVSSTVWAVLNLALGIFFHLAARAFVRSATEDGQ